MGGVALTPASGGSSESPERKAGVNMPKKRRSKVAGKAYEEENSDQEFEDAVDEAEDGVRNYSERYFHPEELKQLIPVFSEGCGVSEWIGTIDHYRQLYSWSDKSTLLYATCRLAGAAHQWFLGSRTHILSWKDFTTMILLAFPDREDEADVHRKLSQCVKDSKESYDNYVFRMNALGQKGKLSSAAIIKYAISGLSYDVIYSSVASRQYDSIYDLLEQIRYCEANQELCKRQCFSSKQSVNNPTSKTPRDDTKSSGTPASVNKRSDECFNCHGTGHISIDCPQPQRRPRCSLCRKVGHDEQHCFKQPQGESQQSNYESTNNQVPEDTECE